MYSFSRVLHQLSSPKSGGITKEAQLKCLPRCTKGQTSRAGEGDSPTRTF